MNIDATKKSTSDRKRNRVTAIEPPSVKNVENINNFGRLNWEEKQKNVNSRQGMLYIITNKLVLCTLHTGGNLVSHNFLHFFFIFHIEAREKNTLKIIGWYVVCYSSFFLFHLKMRKKRKTWKQRKETRFWPANKVQSIFLLVKIYNKGTNRNRKNSETLKHLNERKWR